MADFAFREQSADGVAQLALTGDLDMSATFRLEPALDRLLAADEVGELVLDLGGVNFVDSSGLGLLVATQERTADVDKRMAIVNAGPEVQRVFRIAGLEGVLPLSP